MAKRMNLTPEQLTGALAHEGIDAGTLKQRIRAEVASMRIARASTAPDILRLRDLPPRKMDDGPSWPE
jgi:hypothetical protein